MNVQKIANFINNSKTAQSILKSIDKNPAVYSATASFILAGVLRPTAIGMMPFKEKKDKQYSQASAVAAGLVELGATAALFIPLNKAIKTASDNLYKAKGTIFHENAPALRQFKSVTNRGLKCMALVPISLARFALVKPIVNALFDRGGKNANK